MTLKVYYYCVFNVFTYIYLFVSLLVKLLKDEMTDGQSLHVWA